MRAKPGEVAPAIYGEQPMGGSVQLPGGPQKPAIDVPAAPVPRGSGIKQANLDAQALAAKLQEWGFSPDEAYSMGRKSWEKAAFDAGVPAPTAAVQANAVLGLKKALQGPNRTAAQLFEDFKKAGKK